MIREFSNRRIARQFKRGNLRGAADLGMNHTARAIRYDMRLRGETDAGAVAPVGGFCYNMPRCAAMGGEMPATEQENGTIKTFPRPVNGLPRPVAHFTRLRGGVFASRGEML